MLPLRAVNDDASRTEPVRSLNARLERGAASARGVAAVWTIDGPAPAAGGSPSYWARGARRRTEQRPAERVNRREPRQGRIPRNGRSDRVGGEVGGGGRAGGARARCVRAAVCPRRAHRRCDPRCRGGIAAGAAVQAADAGCRRDAARTRGIGGARSWRRPRRRRHRPREGGRRAFRDRARPRR